MIKQNILSIDSSLQNNLVAMLYNNKLYYNVHTCKHHEKNLLTMIQNLLTDQKARIQDFQIISFTTGPGSFTGIRLSASIAQGLSILNNIHLIGISTLEVLAEQIWRLYKIKKIIICNIANKKQVYWVKYTKNIKNIWNGKEVLLHINQAVQKIKNLKNTWYITGSGKIHFQNLYNPFLKYIETNQSYAKDLIKLTILAKKKKNFFLLNDIQLNYLHNPKY
ncbi:tRNA (adenosine(37)-N6)-threonylcarbamoyltransferase complex dimerization subunit type 1 TsaB [Buchnera aphidicola]|uniref:tRNA threonylcarbamoyladenosine biosynthesis protein TsaB n=1 Tax=Buchnera aphidicola (Sarucallis kahawaluokalani) TaxID=1241878 RepID=A0A4D6YJZ3_9GAMM|nr:tRNA (adenosine(37)-N6)-threonylcarbamoyltransferase complex dimerization subunit type 1 TsaB [Buchnera aphidicola]QCI26018.1 tRNA (adenosine(37)-N6)-threonylcarbamoyltransferase complex dimerization subunit type 1 TsaB [Buchnera aphidicola (Sarucallis kahawaluokalani)]